MRGLFSFAQSYMSEKAGQSVAFDFRNDLFAKIQRLSFSYHDRNRTGPVDGPRHGRRREGAPLYRPGSVDGGAGRGAADRRPDHAAADQLPADAGHLADPAAGAGHVHGLRHDHAAALHQGAGQTVGAQYRSCRRTWPASRSSRPLPPNREKKRFRPLRRRSDAASRSRCSASSASCSR